MKVVKLSVITSMLVSVCGLSACTTVDLSQVAIEQPQEIIKTQPERNVVERASYALTSLFHKKGWCKSGPAEKTKTATNVLLNGIETDTKNTTSFPVTPKVSTRQLSADISQAHSQVEQTTKAADVYLSMADDMAELDGELSQLEAALLSAREAEAGFAQSLQDSSNFLLQRKYDALSNSIDKLKDVTDAYGERIRMQIAARASTERS